MDEQMRFRTALAALSASAEAGNRKLTGEQMQEFFEDMGLTSEQHRFVYAYLSSKGIRVEGVEMPRMGTEESYAPEEEEFLKLYQKQMRQVSKQPKERLETLSAAASDGDAGAKKLLTEHYMERAFELAKEYAHQGLLIQDLVQEASLGLMVGVDTLGLIEEGFSWESHLEREIRRAVRDALDKQAGEKSMGEQVADKLNKLADSITELTEELGRDVTADELSIFLNIPLEEIEELLKIAGENIERTDKT